MECVDDAPDGAEESDKGGSVGDGGEPGHVGLHGGKGFGRCGLRGALQCHRVARRSPASTLALVLVVDLVEYGDQGAGLKIANYGRDLGEAP